MSNLIETEFAFRLKAARSLYNAEVISDDDYWNEVVSVVTKVMQLQGDIESEVLDRMLETATSIISVVEQLTDPSQLEGKPYAYFFLTDIQDHLVEPSTDQTVNVQTLSSWISPDGRYYFVKTLQHTEVALATFLDESKWLKYSPKYGGFVTYKTIPDFKATPAQKRIVKQFYGIELD
jgi:hypothetical protein